MKFLLIFTTVLLSFSATIESASNPYYPLIKGQTIVYDYSSAFSTDEGQQMQIQLGEQLKKIGDHSYLIATTTLGSDDDFDVVATTYIRTNSKGAVVGMLADNSKRKEEVMLPAFPLTVGQTWKNATNGEETVSSVKSLSKTLTTPVKTYKNCLFVETKDDQFTFHSYYQKGVGIIATGFIVEGEEKLMTYLAE